MLKKKTIKNFANKIGKSIYKARLAKGWSQARLAKECKWFNNKGVPSQGRVSHYEKGRRDVLIEDLLTLAKALDTSLNVLVFGKETHPITARGITRVPLLSWKQLNKQITAKTLKAKKAIITVIAPQGIKLSPAAFALNIVGNDAEPEFNDSDIIVIDPERTARTGDYIVAISAHGSHHLYEMVSIKDGGQFYRPLDRQAPMQAIKQKKFTVIGVVVAKTKIYVK